MDAGELRRWLRRQGCTFQTHKGGSGHVTVRLGDRTSQLPMHGGRKELSRGLVCQNQEGPGDGLMLAYPITLTEEDGTILATSPDFPELTTFGEDREEAIARAVDALEEAIAARVHDRKDIPQASPGQTYAVLPTLTSVKVLLYEGMREQGVGKAELARRLGWHLPQVDRVLDVQHRSGFEQLDAAFGALGKRLQVTTTGTAIAAGPEIEEG